MWRAGRDLTRVRAPRHPQGFVEIRPWFRLTPQPDTEGGGM